MRRVAASEAAIKSETPVYVVTFSPPRLIEFRDLGAFSARVRIWLHQREGENTYLIGKLRDQDPKVDSSVRLFLVEQENAIVAAGIRASNGCLYLTWASPEAVKVVIEHITSKHWAVAAVCAPVHIASDIASRLAERDKSQQTLIRTERVFQLSQVSHPLPEEGRLEVAHASDKPFIREWFKAFVEESEFYGDVARDPRAVDWLIDPRRMYLWKSPGPVSMAAWVAPTMYSGAINYVYVPDEHRGRGFAKAVTAALAQQMLASGLRYCLILADAGDARINRLYQSIGAHAVGDLAYFTLEVPSKSPSKIARSGDSHCSAGSRAS